MFGRSLCDFQHRISFVDVKADYHNKSFEVYKTHKKSFLKRFCKNLFTMTQIRYILKTFWNVFQAFSKRSSKLAETLKKLAKCLNIWAFPSSLSGVMVRTSFKRFQIVRRL